MRSDVMIELFKMSTIMQLSKYFRKMIQTQQKVLKVTLVDRKEKCIK
jgi:hypothetical protein